MLLRLLTGVFAATLNFFRRKKEVSTKPDDELGTTRANVSRAGVLCRPCYNAIRSEVLTWAGIDDISIETAMRFATDLKYIRDHGGGLHDICLRGRCVCLHEDFPT